MPRRPHAPDPMPRTPCPRSDPDLPRQISPERTPPHRIRPVTLGTNPLLNHPPVKVDRVGTSGSAKPFTKPGNYCTKSLTECNSALNEKSGPGID